MKVKNQVWSWLTVFALTLSVLAYGCSGGEKEKPKSEPGPTPTKEVKGPETPGKPMEPSKPSEPAKPADPTPGPGAETGPKATGGETKSYHYIMEGENKEEGKFKMEIKADGKKLNIVISKWEGDAYKDQTNMISDGGFTYVMDPASKTAMKMPATGDNEVPADMMIMPKWGEFQKEAAPGGAIEKAGDEKVGDTDTTKYKVKGLEGQEWGFVWVDKEDIIRKIEGYDAANTKTVTMTFTKVELNPKFTDADFKPPAGYTVNDMSEMMKNMPGGGAMPPGGPGMPPGGPGMPPGGGPPMPPMPPGANK